MTAGHWGRVNLSQLGAARADPERREVGGGKERVIRENGAPSQLGDERGAAVVTLERPSVLAASAMHVRC